MNDQISFLEHKAYNMRVSSLIQAGSAGSGHPTTCLSAADIVAVLFFYVMRYNLLNIKDPNNDHFILSKGHASALLYAAWKEVGVLTADDLRTYRKIDSVLEGHPTFRFSHTEAATGSLGIGLSIGVGMALAGNLDQRSYYTYVLMGDSELAEGSIWEAVQLAAHYKLNRLIGIVDCNRLGQSTQTMYDHDVHKLASMFQSFGWHTLEVNGHNIPNLMDVFDQARAVHNKPVVVIAKTFKGYGVDFMQDKAGFHGKATTGEELEKALAQLKERFAHAASYRGSYEWKPAVRDDTHHKKYTCTDAMITLPVPTYKKGEMIATRKAYGQALVALGTICDTVISLDAEVKNSTYAQDFETQFPERFIQSFIAEQNMVSMGVGLNLRGKKSFISTFGAFFTRAHDQIRMAAIGESTIKLIGSHSGVSIGEDGPSQMALEDIAMMRALPQSIVLYPCDAISTYRLLEQMAYYEDGICYMRTTRAATPVIYDNDELFPIGGCKVVRHSREDKVCIIAAGITVFEALKAYDILALQMDAIFVSVIDLYSVKPLDVETIIKIARASHKKVITVEDHYPEGGIGEAVCAALAKTDIIVECLSVDRLPRSGTPEELMAYVHIDANTIVQKVKSMIM